LEPGERLADAVVRAEAEGEDLPRSASYVEAIRVVEVALVAVRGGDEQRHVTAGGIVWSWNSTSLATYLAAWRGGGSKRRISSIAFG